MNIVLKYMTDFVLRSCIFNIFYNYLICLIDIQYTIAIAMCPHKINEENKYEITAKK